MTTITDAGVYDLDDETYHADPVPGGSLSSTGARRILDSPARFAYERERRVVKAAYDVGHAVHAMVLGVGMPAVAIPDEHLSASGSTGTKAAREFIEEARAEGKVPLKSDVVAEVEAMAGAVLGHPLAARILARDGQPEASAFAQDPATGAWLRARPDFLPDAGPGRTVLVDLKTSITADPRLFGREAAKHHYEQQADLYQQVVTLARGDQDTAFIHVVVEKAPPYLVSVIELDADALRIGHERNRLAIDLYAACVAADEWPGYPPHIATVSLPVWASYELEELTA